MSDESDEYDTDAGDAGSPGADPAPSDSPDADPTSFDSGSDSDAADPGDDGPASDQSDEADAGRAGSTDPADEEPTDPDDDPGSEPEPEGEDDGGPKANGTDDATEPGTLHRVDDDRAPDPRDADPTPEEDDDADANVEFTEQDPEEVPEAVRDTPSPGDLVDDAGSGGAGGGGAGDPMSAAAEPAGHGAGGGGGGAPAPTPPVTGEEEVGGILGGHEEKPPDDEEMPLADHIEEMVKRLAVVVIAIALATAVAFPFATDALNAMWYGLLPPDTPPPHLYGPLEKILSEIKVASLAGILVALPVLVYEAYLFMRPGLYPKERRYFLSAVPTSLVLGAIGMAFAYFLVLPVLFDYFVLYSESGVDKLAFGLRVTFDLIVALLGAFALVFQIPLLIMLAILMGVTTRRWLESRRIYFWAGFLGLGFLMGGADLTGMAPIIIAATMIGLFEGTLALLRWTQRG